MPTGLGTGLDLAAYPALAQARPTGLPQGTDPSMPATVNGNTGLLGQTTIPKAPKLSGTWNAQTGQFNLNTVLQQLQTSQDQANQANVTRYNDLLQSISNTGNQVGGTYNQALGLLDTQGQAAATRIGQQTEQNIAGNQQGLVSRGLGNTTIGVNLDQQARQQGEQALQASNEAVAGQKAGILQNQAGAQLNVGQMTSQGIQSLTQQAPNMQLYSDMIKGATQGQTAQTAATKQAAATQQASMQQALSQPQYGQSGGGGGLSPSTPSSGGGSSSGGGGGTYLSGGGSGGSSPQGGTGNVSSYSGGQSSGMGDMGQYPSLSGAAGDLVAAAGASGQQDFTPGTGGVDTGATPDTMEIPSKPEITSESVTGQGGASVPAKTATAGKRQLTKWDVMTMYPNAKIGDWVSV